VEAGAPWAAGRRRVSPARPERGVGPAAGRAAIPRWERQRWREQRPPPAVLARRCAPGLRDSWPAMAGWTCRGASRTPRRSAGRRLPPRRS